uniref:Uncharacterized protein n=1 Tax=Anopheles atroparvus TaxID=41427 RepID=A0AAG5D6W2_ANOAO
MHLVYRDSLLLLVCFGFVLSSEIAKHVQGRPIASTPPRLDDGGAEGVNTETSSSTAPSTSLFSSTTITSTTSTSTTTTAGTSESSPSVGTPPVFALARANTTPSSSASIKSIAATTRTTPQPSAKRQISLNEFQQLVAKVNDEIGMLRNQSANLSQTYDELVQRYNERTSQIPIVLYDVTNCSNDSTLEEKQHTTAPSEREGSMQLAVEGTTNARGLEGSTGADRTTVIPSTTTESTAAALSSTETVSPENDPSLGDAAQSAATPETVPQNPSNAQTQIYGNKYYNYVHYFMYPPSEDLLKEVLSPPNTNFRRKQGHFSPNVARIRHRHAGHGLEQGEDDSLEEESTGNGNAAKDNRWRFPPNYRSRPWNERERPQPVPNYAMAGPLDSPAPLAHSAPPASPASFPYEIPYRRRINANPRPSFNEDLVRPNPVNYLRTEERTTQRNPYLDELPLGGLSKPAERFYPQPSVKPPKPVIDVPTLGAAPSERLESFLERRRKVNVPPVTPWRTTVATERSTTLPSLDSLISGGLKSVSFSIPTTVKPVPGVARNGWDGYDFTFVRKVFENQKRNQTERRTEQLIGRSL